MIRRKGKAVAVPMLRLAAFVLCLSRSGKSDFFFFQDVQGFGGFFLLLLFSFRFWLTTLLLLGGTG